MKKRIFGCLLALMVLSLFSACKNTHKAKTHSKTTVSKAILLSNPEREASCVSLTADRYNAPIASWVETDSSGKKYFYFSRFDTVSNSFDHPVPIPIEQNASIHVEGMPKIAVKGNGSLFAVYEVSVPKKGLKWGLGDIHYIQSFDGGKTWTTPKSIAPKDHAERISASYAALARLANGQIGISWLSTNLYAKKMGRPVKFAQTIGKTGMGQPVLIDPRACECCRTAISASKNGRIAIAYRDLRPGNIRDISLAISTNGTAFSPPIFFTDEHWAVNGCPHAGPGLAMANDSIYVTWFTGSDKDSGLNYAVLDSSGQMRTKKHIGDSGRYIQVSLMPNGTPIIAHNKSYHDGNGQFSAIVAEKIKDGNLLKTKISRHNIMATFPVVQAYGKNQAIIAWSGENKVHYKLIDTKAINTPAIALPSLLSLAE